MDLELATNKELMDELTGRGGFLGVVLYSSNEDKGQGHSKFSLISTMDTERNTVNILMGMGLSLQAQLDESEEEE